MEGKAEFIAECKIKHVNNEIRIKNIKQNKNVTVGGKLDGNAHWHSSTGTVSCLQFYTMAISCMYVKQVCMCVYIGIFIQGSTCFSIG